MPVPLRPPVHPPILIILIMRQAIRAATRHGMQSMHSMPSVHSARSPRHEVLVKLVRDEDALDVEPDGAGASQRVLLVKGRHGCGGRGQGRGGVEVGVEVGGCYGRQWQGRSEAAAGEHRARRAALV